MALTWIDKPFEKLSNLELYNIMTLRQEVFIVEQDCVYLDNDGKDEGAWHLWAEDKLSNVVAYARILAPNVSYEEASLSRIVTHLDYRSKGLGQELMKRSIDLMESLHGSGQCRIGAVLSSGFLQKLWLPVHRRRIPRGWHSSYSNV